MSDDRTNTEELPNGAEYERTFNRVGDHLKLAAHKLTAGLLPIDVSGIMFAAAIEFLREYEDDAYIVNWIRDLADSLERGEIGFRHGEH